MALTATTCCRGLPLSYKATDELCIWNDTDVYNIKVRPYKDAASSLWKMGHEFYVLLPESAQDLVDKYVFHLPQRK